MVSLCLVKTKGMEEDGDGGWTYRLATTGGHGHRGEEDGGEDGQLHCD